VKVEEPSEDLATQMLRGIIPNLEKHHKVRIRANGVKEAVRLSSRYISGRQLPDKAVSLMDTACARVALSRAAVPEVIEDARRNLGDLEREKAAIEHEEDQRPHGPRLAELAAEAETQQAALKKAQRALLAALDAASEALKQAKAAEAPDPKAVKRLEDDWAKAFDAYRVDHKANPMIHADVDESIIAEVVSGWTGIPLGRMVQDEIATVQNLSSHLQQRVVGQNHAMDRIAKQLQIAWSGLEDPTKPRGVFLLTGPSGVGKTETALALADLLYGGDRNMVIINMSEYQEAHSVSGLKGSPPGYVGFGEGGVLTEGVRRKPYSVVLLDEVEKAHPDVLELFYQVFDKGNLEDSEGASVDFKNTVIILTSNVGTDVIQRATEGGVTVDGKNRKPTPDDLAELVRPQLLKTFKPAFIGRMQVIPYLQLGDEVLAKIIGLKLGKIQKRFKTNFGAELTYDPALLEVIRERCTEQESGARNAEAILNQSVLATLSERVLSRMAEGKPVTSGHISVSKKGALTIKLT